RSEKLPGFFVTHFIREPNYLLAGRRGRGPDDYVVVEPGRSLVPARGCGNHHAVAVFDLHVAIAESPGAAPCDTPHLKPDQIVCVINHSHLVGFRVAHVDNGINKIQRRSLDSHKSPVPGSDSIMSTSERLQRRPRRGAIRNASHSPENTE